MTHQEEIHHQAFLSGFEDIVDVGIQKARKTPKAGVDLGQVWPIMKTLYGSAFDDSDLDNDIVNGITHTKGKGSVAMGRVISAVSVHVMGDAYNGCLKRLDTEEIDGNLAVRAMMNAGMVVMMFSVILDMLEVNSMKFADIVKQREAVEGFTENEAKNSLDFLSELGIELN
jgi:hypothetical protein